MPKRRSKSSRWPPGRRTAAAFLADLRGQPGGLGGFLGGALGQGLTLLPSLGSPRLDAAQLWRSCPAPGCSHRPGRRLGLPSASTGSASAWTSAS